MDVRLRVLWPLLEPQTVRSWDHGASGPSQGADVGTGAGLEWCRPDPGPVLPPSVPSSVRRQGGQATETSLSCLPLCTGSSLLPARGWRYALHFRTRHSTISIHISERTEGRHFYLLCLELFSISSLLLCLINCTF